MATTRDWRTYSEWGSLICGLLAVLTTVVFFVHANLSPPANDPSPISPAESIWMMAAFPVSLIGFMLGTLGKEVPRIAGLVMCGSVLLLLLLASIAV
jgi:hypothetical protein